MAANTPSRSMEYQKHPATLNLVSSPKSSLTEIADVARTTPDIRSQPFARKTWEPERPGRNTRLMKLSFRRVMPRTQSSTSRAAR